MNEPERKVFATKFFQIGDEVEVEGSVANTSNQFKSFLWNAWFKGKITGIRTNEHSEIEYQVQLEGFTTLKDFYTYENFLRRALPRDSLPLSEKLYPGERVEVVGLLPEEERGKDATIGYWEAVVVSDKGPKVKVRYTNEYYGVESTPRDEVRKGESEESVNRRETCRLKRKKEFENRLVNFMASRGRPIKLPIVLYHKPVDLHWLYTIISFYGGIEKVSETYGLATKIWRKMDNYNEHDTAGVSCLKRIYYKCLYPFELAFYHHKSEEEIKQRMNEIKIMHQNAKAASKLQKKDKKERAKEDDSNLSSTDIDRIKLDEDEFHKNPRKRKEEVDSSPPRSKKQRMELMDSMDIKEEKIDSSVPGQKGPLRILSSTRVIPKAKEVVNQSELFSPPSPPRIMKKGETDVKEKKHKKSSDEARVFKKVDGKYIRPYARPCWPCYLNDLPCEYEKEICKNCVERNVQCTRRRGKYPSKDKPKDELENDKSSSEDESESEASASSGSDSDSLSDDMSEDSESEEEVKVEKRIPIKIPKGLIKSSPSRESVASNNNLNNKSPTNTFPTPSSTNNNNNNSTNNNSANPVSPLTNSAPANVSTIEQTLNPKWKLKLENKINTLKSEGNNQTVVKLFGTDVRIADL